MNYILIKGSLYVKIQDLTPLDAEIEYGSRLIPGTKEGEQAVKPEQTAESMEYGLAGYHK